MRHLDGTYDLTVDDIHEIRECNFELTKNMTCQELIEYYNKKGKEAIIKMGLKNLNEVDAILA